jgi:MFS transporter, PPP family, 3-phenylpropionic acid transporter
MLPGRVGALAAFIVLYTMMYAAFGAASPFWPRFFESRGLPPEQLGILLGLGVMIRLVAGPFAGRLADQLGALRAVLATCAVSAAAMTLGLLTVEGFWLLALVHMGHAAALAPITTLADALALNAGKQTPTHKGFEYGWVRGSASAAFIVGTLIAGQVLVSADLSAIVWMQAALLVGVAFGSRLVPGIDARLSQDGIEAQSAWGGVRELFRIAAFRRLLMVAALIYGSHAMHDGFAVIRWNAAGIGPTAVSVLWSESVAAEVLVFFLIGPPLINRLGPSGAAALAASAGIVRWVVMSQTTELVALAFVQPLHGFTFALLHLACMRMIAVIVPVWLAATAQALYALGPGLATALLIPVSGLLYEQWGGDAFLVMALLCAAALPLALRLHPEGSRTVSPAG